MTDRTDDVNPRGDQDAGGAQRGYGDGGHTPYGQLTGDASDQAQGGFGGDNAGGRPGYFGESGGGSAQQDHSPAAQRSRYQSVQGYGAQQDHHEPHYRQWRDTQLAGHDRDYARWRDEQARKYDEDYKGWRNERHSAFSNEFETWRSGRSGGATAAAGGAQAGSGRPAEVAREAVVDPNAVHGANPALAEIADGHAGAHRRPRPEDDNSVDSQG